MKPCCCFVWSQHWLSPSSESGVLFIWLWFQPWLPKFLSCWSCIEIWESPASPGACEVVLYYTCRACKVLYYTWPFVLARIELVKYCIMWSGCSCLSIMCIFCLCETEYCLKYEEYESDRWDPLTWQIETCYQNLSSGTHLTNGPI